MLSKLPEWKCRQKVKPRICDDADPETALECFQVSVNILEAKNLAWASSKTGDTYVIVTLGKEKHKTVLKKKYEDNNNCREYLLFEWYTNLKEIQRSNLCMSVMESRCCAPPRLLGETSIDLGIVWAQPNHQVFHKWAQLILPRNPIAGTVGFLKVDISIVTREMQVMPVMISPQKHKEIMQSTSEQQAANYVLCIYNAFSIAPKLQEPRQEKLPSTYIKVTFCGISVKTAVQVRTSNPAYCERVSIVEMFPNICQSIRLEVCSTEQTLNPVLASVDLNLGHISHDGDNGFVPSFGPSLLHMYGTSLLGIETPSGEGPFYKGTLLIALKTVVPYSQRAIHTTNVEPIIPLKMENLFAWHDYCIYCPIFEVSMLNRQLAGNRCGVAFTLGEVTCAASLNEDFMSYKRETKKRKLHYTGPIQLANSSNLHGHLNFTNSFPILQHATCLPGFKFRVYRNNFVQKITENLENALANVENRLNTYVHSKPSEILEDLSKALNDAADNILKFFEYVDYFDPSTETSRCGASQYFTELDKKQLALQKEELDKIYRQIRSEMELNSAVNLLKMISKTSSECYSISKKHVKTLLIESIAFAQKLKALIFKSPLGWPDIVVWLLNDGSRFAYHKISIADIIFSEIPMLRGKDCGRIQTVYLKPLKCLKHLNTVPNICTCIAGKVELLFWASLYTEIACFDTCVPQGIRLKSREYDMCLKAPVIMVKIRIFIYRAKLMVGENIAQPSPFVRINVMNYVTETQVQGMTTAPIWDQVLTVNCMVRSSHERIVASPPEIMVEVYHYESTNTNELIGRLKIIPVVGHTLNIDYAPQLKWYNLFLGTENVGQILMSASIQQLPETLVKSTIYSSLNEVSDVNLKQDVGVDVDNDIIEQLPPCVKPKYSVYKVDIYWWGLRELCITKKPCAVLEIDNLTIKSDVIADRKANCNFPNGRISHTFEGNLENTYSSPLTIRLYDSSTFGRILFFGTNAVKNPIKYLVDWIPKTDRESSLRSVSVTSSSFVKVNRTLFIKKQTSSRMSISEGSKMTITNSVVDKKWSSWKRIFCKAEPDTEEEKYVLLPMHFEKSHDLLPKSRFENDDWWSRFFASPSDCEKSGNKIKVYNSELELQPEFSKFKDWCKSMKLYNGKKSGLPDKDEELRSGILKVGIAIYRWPPPPHTIAVSWSGVELDKGYFNKFPSNDSAKFLVRVYIVRALNLTLKQFNNSCNPYVRIKCGTKQCGDRSEIVKNTVNPIFGRTFEFQCSLPEDYMLNVSLYNNDNNEQDSLIGSTSIDLEDRIYSKHRGQVGLASEYSVTGPSKWRDCEKPSDILTKLCARNHVGPPTFPDGNTVIVNGIEYRECDKTSRTYISATERKENLCLSLLHKWHTLPLCGYHLVPEHVETRSLYDLEKPTIDQGKLLMWVDIFPMETGLFTPLPVDITPRKVEDYELRIIIWHVQSLGRGSMFSKKGMDLYVKAWIGNVEQAHYTDIHYNCTNGEASFNWRMVFNFQYQHADNKLILMEKGPFTEYEERVPPILILQVADSDADSIDDYLATLTLDLSAIPRGSRQILRNSVLDNMENAKKINLFTTRSLRSWWPLKTVNKDTGAVKFEGMIDMELHLLPKEKAVLLPVGIGRDSPFPLPMPNRPEATKFSSSALENMFQRGGAEYIVIGILLTLLVIVFCLQFPKSLDNFAFYF